MRRLYMMALALCLTVCLTACRSAPSVVGTWMTDGTDAYSFRLAADGSCVMLDSDGEWVSDGTYTADDDRILFETDTGDFVWVRTDEGMLFHANGHDVLYRFQK